MRRSSLVLGSALLGVLVAPVPHPAASASCAGPYVEVDEGLILERGATMAVDGGRFVDGCRDSMGCEVRPGCDDCEYDDPPPRPQDDIRLELTQGNRSWSLDLADADSSGAVTWTFRVPRSVRSGRARLVVGYLPPVEVRVR